MDQLILYILIFAALVVIAGLVAFVVYYRRRLNILQSAMARCIEENIEMKDKLCEQNVIYHPGRIKLTSEDFTRIMSNMLKRLVLINVTGRGGISVQLAKDDSSHAKTGK